MDTVVVIVAIAVLAVVVLAGLLVGGRRRQRPPAAPPPPPPSVGYRPGADEEAEATPRTPAGTIDAGTVPEVLIPPVPPEAVPVPPLPPEAPEIPAPTFEIPAPTAGRLTRLRARLARSQSTLGRGLLTLLSRDTLDDETWEEVEETLLITDVGVGPTQELVERLRTRVKVLGTRDPTALRGLLREELLALVGTDVDRSLHTSRHVVEQRPAVVLVVGVNGTGKTTTTGKLARVLIAEGRAVVLGAADTFRAAAADQLETWGERVGAIVVRGPEGGDPASVAFDAVRQGIELEADTVVIDTAGRLHTKVGLMDELGKVKRVVEKQAPVDEVLLVLDATTGQNGMVQARVFADVVNITGLALTKLDGTAKGGIVVAVQRELGVPVKLVGLGEGPDDLAPFEPEAFVDALLSDGTSS
jgi:fused signal recognition particle receptor